MPNGPIDHPDGHGLDHLIPDCRSIREVVFANHDRAPLSDVVTTAFDLAPPATVARAVPQPCPPPSRRACDGDIP